MKRRGDKAHAQWIHFRRRLHQRYGIEISREEYSAACRAIAEGNSTPVADQSHRVRIHDVEIRGTVVRVAYDRRRKTLATALPAGSWEVQEEVREP